MNATHVCHKIRITGRKSKYSAWFRADPICGLDSGLTVLVDCERIDALGRAFPCTETEKTILTQGGWHYGRLIEFNAQQRGKGASDDTTSI